MKVKQDWLHAPCSECGGQPRWKTISQEFEREGLRVTVSGIQALVCEKCGEIYFAPGSAQALAEAVNNLYVLAHKSRQHKGNLVATANAKRSPKKPAVV